MERVKNWLIDIAIVVVFKLLLLVARLQGEQALDPSMARGWWDVQQEGK